MVDGLGLYMKDLYPNFSGVETSNTVVPDVDDQESLNEDTQVAEEASTTEASRKQVFLALGMVVLLVVFFGAGGGR